MILKKRLPQLFSHHQVQCEAETKETEKSNPTHDCDAKCDDKTENIM